MRLTSRRITRFPKGRRAGSSGARVRRFATRPPRVSATCRCSRPSSGWRKHPRWGYRLIHALLEHKGWTVNLKRVRRLWRESNLQRKVRRRRPDKLGPKRGTSANSCVNRPARFKNDVWTYDFVADRTASGKPLRWLTLVDEYTKECLALHVAASLTGQDVRAVLARVIGRRVAAYRPQRQRLGVRLRGPDGLAAGEGGRADPGSPGQPLGERRRRVVQQPRPRRVPRAGGVRGRQGRQGERKVVQARIQHSASAQFAGLQDAQAVQRRVRRRLARAA